MSEIPTIKIPPEFADIAKAMPSYKPSVIFDVGANIGQSCVSYARIFPEATIHAFEPVPAAFEQLCNAAAPFPKIQTHNIALSSKPGTVKMKAVGTSTANKIVRGPLSTGVQYVDVRAEEGHEIAAKLEVREISYLKIDTEGFDLEVLIGFQPILAQTDFVQVEASMNPYNKVHVPFRALEDFLRAQNFYLFKIYEQRLEFTRGGRPILRRSNPLFINARLVDLSQF
jgi:FkbM family methyltransferase